jgi:hypothetical protein
MKASPHSNEAFPVDRRTPRWVKVSYALGLAFVLAFAGLHLTGRGFQHHHHAAEPATGSPAAGGRSAP